MQEDCRTDREKIQDNFKYMVEQGILKPCYWLPTSAPCASPQAEEWPYIVMQFDLIQYGLSISIVRE
jgi:hypothetical protein